MDQLQTVTGIIALTMGAAWASGINLYATLLVLGLMGATGSLALPEGLTLLTHPLVIGAAGLMYLVEFFADKMPGVDTGWDTVHTFIRIPAGALLAAGAVGEMDPAVALAAGIVGGGLAAGTHALKSGTRILINASPEPFSNWVTSFAEDILVIGGLWTALHHPEIFLCFIVVFIALMLWLLPRIWRGIRALFQRIRGWFRPKEAMNPPLGAGGGNAPKAKMVE